MDGWPSLFPGLVIQADDRGWEEEEVEKVVSEERGGGRGEGEGGNGNLMIMISIVMVMSREK